MYCFKQDNSFCVLINMLPMPVIGVTSNYEHFLIYKTLLEVTDKHKTTVVITLNDENIFFNTAFLVF